MSGFAALEVEQKTFRVYLVHPITEAALVLAADYYKDGENFKAGDQAYIEVHGYLSEAGEPFRKKARIAAATKGRGPQSAAAQANEDKLRDENAEMLAALTESWLLVDFDGAPIEDECNRANAKKLFGNKKLGWVARQVLQELNEEANFIQA